LQQKGHLRVSFLHCDGVIGGWTHGAGGHATRRKGWRSQGATLFSQSNSDPFKEINLTLITLCELPNIAFSILNATLGSVAKNNIP
jgi:hypothetical protein